MTDQIQLGAIAHFFPVSEIEQILVSTQRQSQRIRQLPARVMVYYVIAMALWMDVSCREVLRCLVEGLSGGVAAERVRRSGRAAISMARARLGAEPLRCLFERCVKPIATEKTRGAWYREWRLVSLDGSTLDVADTADNASAFGRPGTARGDSAYPKLRFVALLETGTHVIFRTAWGAYRDGECKLAARILDGLQAGMLCVADRGFFSFVLWQAARAKGADLVWRVKSHLVLPCEQRLPDGSYLSHIFPSQYDRRLGRNGQAVRVVEYRAGWIRGQGERIRLITTVLDAKRAPAPELAALYHERWEIENTLDELKTHLRGRQIVLRSQKPELVEQEFYGLLLAHFAIRGLMHEAAQRENVDPDTLSFVHSFRVVKRKLPAFLAISPSAAPCAA